MSSDFYTNLFPILTPNANGKTIVANTDFGKSVMGVSGSSDFAPFLTAMELAAERYIMPFVGSVIETHFTNLQINKLFKRTVAHYTIVQGLVDKLLTLSEAGLVTAQVQGVQQVDITRYKIRLYAAICAADVCLDALITALLPLDNTFIPCTALVQSLRDVEAIINCDGSWRTYDAMLPYIERRESAMANLDRTLPATALAIRNVAIAQGAIDYLQTNPVLKFPRGIRVLSNMEHNNNTVDAQTIRNQAIANEITLLKEAVLLWQSKLSDRAPRSQIQYTPQGNTIGIHRKRR